jgi:hypothetical protein
MDLLGHTLSTTRVAAGSLEYSVDVETLVPGMYFLSYETREGNREYIFIRE